MIQCVQIPTRTDNYAYLVVHGRRAFVVDASEAAPVLQCLADFPGVTLEAVVNTHHHHDHVGGNLRLVSETGCEVIGAACDAERIPGITRRVEFGARIEVADLPLHTLDVRAHTRGHIAYRCDRAVDQVVRHGHRRPSEVIPRLAGRKLLFVGDSLFLAGCGRLREGSPEDLARAMGVLAREDPEALVCCAHEYTEANLRFAAAVLPHVAAVHERLAGLGQERSLSGSTVPDTLARELRTNPYLLGLDPSHWEGIARSLGMMLSHQTRVADVLGALRAAKDRF